MKCERLGCTADATTDLSRSNIAWKYCDNHAKDMMRKWFNFPESVKVTLKKIKE